MERDAHEILNEMVVVVLEWRGLQNDAIIAAIGGRVCEQPGRDFLAIRAVLLDRRQRLLDVKRFLVAVGPNDHQSFRSGCIEKFMLEWMPKLIRERDLLPLVRPWLVRQQHVVMPETRGVDEQEGAQRGPDAAHDRPPDGSYDFQDYHTPGARAPQGTRPYNGVQAGNCLKG